MAKKGEWRIAGESQIKDGYRQTVTICNGPDGFVNAVCAVWTGIDDARRIIKAIKLLEAKEAEEAAAAASASSEKMA